MDYFVTEQNGGGYANNYVATLEIETDAMFRPNRHQDVAIDSA